MAIDLDPTARLARLNDGQLDVVRLVAQHMSSKEIGRELGISHHTVDQRLKRVQGILGVSGRAEAARIYSAMVDPARKGLDEAWGELVYQSPDLPGHSRITEGEASPGEPNRLVDRSTTTLRQSQAMYTANADWQAARPWYSVLLEAGRTNDLTPLARTLCIGVIMLVAVTSLAAIVSLAEGLSRIF